MKMECLPAFGNYLTTQGLYLLYSSLFLSVESANVTATCKVGYGYPVSCPGPKDPPTYTRCCRYYMTPKCCEERAGYVCSESYLGWHFDPDPSYDAIFCPQPGQSDSHVACCTSRVGSNLSLSCCPIEMLAGIVGGVFGLVLLIGLIIWIRCCVLFKKGYYEWYKVGPGHYILRRVRKTPNQDPNATAAAQGLTLGLEMEGSKYIKGSGGMLPI